MTPDQMPACVCDAHPAGDDRKKYMYVAEERPEFVVFACKRCTEITRTPVIQVRSLSNRDMAQHQVKHQRKQMDPKLLRMIHERKRGRILYRREDGN